MEGVIIRKQGAGTFINEANLLVKTRLEEVIPYDLLIKEHGYTPSIELINIEEKPAASEVVQSLKLGPNQRVLNVQKLFLANNTPVIFTDSWIPLDIITRAYTPTDFLMPTYQFLPTFCQQNLSYFLSDIVPLIAPPWLIDYLKIPTTNTALLSFEEVGYNDTSHPIIKATSYFRDDLLRLRLMRRHQ